MAYFNDISKGTISFAIASLPIPAAIAQMVEHVLNLDCHFLTKD